jgi:hypothetical protein
MLIILPLKLSRKGHLNGRSNSKPCHKNIGSLEVQLHAFLTSTLDSIEWSLPFRFTSGEITQGTR